MTRRYYHPGQNPLPRRPSNGSPRERAPRTATTMTDREKIALAERRRAERAAKRRDAQAAQAAKAAGGVS